MAPYKLNIVQTHLRSIETLADNLDALTLSSVKSYSRIGTLPEAPQIIAPSTKPSFA
jgi:hypothetical protein